MALQDTYIKILRSIPGVASPLQRLTFKQKLKWTGLILVIYFVMGQTPLFGVSTKSYEQLRFLEILLGSSFGYLMTLGIGPIVTASIILQMLVGSKLVPWNLREENGRLMFQGTQKLLAVALSFVEGFVFVSFGAVSATAPNMIAFVVLQLAAGGIIVIFMDELVSKWGFGSGVSLFILAGVSKTIIVRLLNPLTQAGSLPGPGSGPVGIIPFIITAIGSGEIFQAMLSFMPIVATLVVFFLVIYTNAIRIEIPLAFGMLRGFGRRWPLKYFYTSNISVILIAALLANVQLMGRMLSEKGFGWLATYDASGGITGGLLYFLTPTSNEAIAGLLIFIGVFALVGAFLSGYAKKNAIKFTVIFSAIGCLLWFVLVYSLNLTSLATIPLTEIGRLFAYSAFLIAGSAVFSFFWVYTSGMDAKSVAEQISSIGMQIPGYRSDIRIIESVLQRYIPALTILGGMSVGFLAAFADFTNALGTGTGLLLSTMIVQQLYEDIAVHHMEDMHPAFRKFMGKM
jgi:preprotein translocase subunit SecY